MPLTRARTRHHCGWEGECPKRRCTFFGMTEPGPPNLPILKSLAKPVTCMPAEAVPTHTVPGDPRLLRTRWPLTSHASSQSSGGTE
jgi:hypothetical protein